MFSKGVAVALASSAAAVATFGFIAAGPSPATPATGNNPSPTGVDAAPPWPLAGGATGMSGGGMPMITSVDEACTHRGVGAIAPVLASDGTVRAYRC